MAGCNECWACAESAHTREQAIRNWNSGRFTKATVMLNTPHEYTKATEVWVNLRDAIVKTAYDRYKEGVVQQMLHPENEEYSYVPGESWFLSEDYRRLVDIDGGYLIKLAHLQAPYDIWRMEKNCRRCKAKWDQCIHKSAYRWQDWMNGNRSCPIEEGRITVRRKKA